MDAKYLFLHSKARATVEAQLAMINFQNRDLGNSYLCVPSSYTSRENSFILMGMINALLELKVTITSNDTGHFACKIMCLGYKKLSKVK